MNQHRRAHRRYVTGKKIVDQTAARAAVSEVMRLGIHVGPGARAADDRVLTVG